MNDTDYDRSEIQQDGSINSVIPVYMRVGLAPVRVLDCHSFSAFSSEAVRAENITRSSRRRLQPGYMIPAVAPARARSTRPRERPRLDPPTRQLKAS